MRSGTPSFMRLQVVCSRLQWFAVAWEMDGRPLWTVGSPDSDYLPTTCSRTYLRTYPSPPGTCRLIISVWCLKLTAHEKHRAVETGHPIAQQWSLICVAGQCLTALKPVDLVTH